MAWLGDSGSGVSQEVQPSCLSVLKSSEGSTVAGASAVTGDHSRGWQVECWLWVEAQFLTTWTSPRGSLSALTTWRLVSSRASDSREQGRSHNAFYDLVSEVTLSFL